MSIYEKGGGQNPVSVCKHMYTVCFGSTTNEKVHFDSGGQGMPPSTLPK